MKQELYEYLVAHAGVGAVVGDRIWQNTAKPNETRPFIVFTRVSQRHGRSFSQPDDKAFMRVQIDCYAATNAACETVSEAVRNALDGFRGDMEGATVAQTYLDVQRDFPEDPIDGTAAPLCRTMMEFVVAHDQTVPTF